MSGEGAVSPPVLVKPGGDDKPGAFTRFVIPFAYRTVKAEPPPKGGGQKWTWQEDKSRERRLYLTPETDAVLHGRAKWLKLEGDGVEFDFEAGVGPDRGCAGREKREFWRLPPKMVLFEWDDDGTHAGKAGSPDEDLLRTGFLVLDIEVRDAKTSLDDLLFFNERFRYWLCPWEGHEKKESNKPDSGSGYGDVVRNYLEKAKECLPERAVGDPYLERWDALLRLPLNLGDGQYSLVDNDAISNARAWAKAGKGASRGWVVYTDNRAFVWACAVIDGTNGGGSGGGALAKTFGSPVSMPHRFGHWLRLVNVDPPAETPCDTHAGMSAFEMKWIKAATYSRWAHWGSWYGYCQHAGAAIVPPSENPPLWTHFRDIYFDQVLLLLYLRVATFRFSQRLCDISIEARKAPRNDEAMFQQRFRKLRWEFALLTNLYRFPLVSSQQQGIEMYALARKQLDVDELFGEVEQEIRASEEYLSSRVNLEQSKTATGLQVVATLAVPIGLALAVAQVEPGGARWWAAGFVGIASWLGTLALWDRTDRVARWMGRMSRCLWLNDAARRREEGCDD